MINSVYVTIQKIEGGWKAILEINHKAIEEKTYKTSHSCRRELGKLSTAELPRIEWGRIWEQNSASVPILYPDLIYIKEKYGIQ